MAMVFHAEGLDGSEKLLLLAYTNYTDAHGYCWPGVARLAADTGTSVPTVKRVRKKLETKNLLRHQRRTTKKGDAMTNMYRVNLDKLRSMVRSNTDFDDNLLEFDFEPEPEPKPAAKPGHKRAAKPEPEPEPELDSAADDSADDGADADDIDVQAPDQPIVQFDPTPRVRVNGGGVKLTPPPGQNDPTPVQDDPQSLSDPSGDPSVDPELIHHPHPPASDETVDADEGSGGKAAALVVEVEAMLREIRIPTGVRQPGPRSRRWRAVIDRCVTILGDADYGLEIRNLRRNLSVDLNGVRDVLAVWQSRLTDDELPSPPRRPAGQDWPTPVPAEQPPANGSPHPGQPATVPDDERRAALRAAFGVPRGPRFTQRLGAIDQRAV